MTRAKRLEPIADYAGKLEDEAARRLAASAKALQTKEREVEQLRSYLAEYRQRAELEQQSTDSIRWQNSRAFLARLSNVVAAQETELKNAVEHYRLETERWRDSYRRSKSLDQFIERGQREAAQVLEKRAQAELDESALRRQRTGR
jgi:flagellar export protein FliJ